MARIHNQQAGGISLGIILTLLVNAAFNYFNMEAPSEALANVFKELSIR